MGEISVSPKKRHEHGHHCSAVSVHVWFTVGMQMYRRFLIDLLRLFFCFLFLNEFHFTEERRASHQCGHSSSCTKCHDSVADFTQVHSSTLNVPEFQAWKANSGLRCFSFSLLWLSAFGVLLFLPIRRKSVNFRIRRSEAKTGLSKHVIFVVF